MSTEVSLDEIPQGQNEVSLESELSRKRMLCAIHTHPRYKSIKEANAWEVWLEVRYGVDSCKFLNNAELAEVLDIFNYKVPDRDYTQRKGDISAAQRAKIENIMNERGFEREGKINFIVRQLGTFKPIWALNKAEASKVITGLQKIIGER
ncbi:DUF1018 domain-containing protein [Helicobacter sp. MIT 21-1697]|uniref:phage protein GemA/Gp16 family protein n=1 Tax=Helicobacter sp. MIT 21-1697 TaxID=2993733 RepID=UPI00224AE59D|nr:phage protein GemA/Gp16 family protein [Helicobacter sp. MIT 21-1697]MCX2717794.1 DUF1018 domain-containing protein [Helicobacter sp. MIT 21-1697]